MNITHVEYGMYLVAVGTEMRKRNLCLHDVIEPASDDLKTKILNTMTAQGMSIARAPEVFEHAYVAMRAINLKTYQSRNAATKADEEDAKEESE